MMRGMKLWPVTHQPNPMTRDDPPMRETLRVAGFALVIVLSGWLSLLHYGGLDSLYALLLVVALQFYLPGWLLARALGKLSVPHPISRFAWVLTCAFALTICLGGLARYVQIPVVGFIVGLHALMLILLALPAPPATHDDNWRWSWRRAPLYALVALCCAIVLSVGLERGQFRFNGFEDQTVFISLADWLANNPDDPGIRSRRIGVTGGDNRWDTDGWTYTHAVWSRSSDRAAAQLIWFDLTPLFVWTIPLAVFALAYELTRRETTAAWSAAALTCAGLLTLDSLVYYPTTLAFGQFALFQVNTLRTIATALVTPLALLAAFAYLRRPSGRGLILIVLIGLALASLHPRQIVIFLYSAGGTALLWWLAGPTWARFRQMILFGGALTLLLGLPLLQRLQRPLRGAATRLLETSNDPRGGYLMLENLPLVGDSFIVSPATVFYHPLIVIVVVLGLLAAWRWRRGPAAQYVSATTVITLLLLFTPGLTPIFTRLVSSVLAPGIVLGLPVALVLGGAVDWLLRRGRHEWPQTVGALIAAVALLALLIEPIPIPASARDQIRASNLLQAQRDINPWDEALIATLNDILPRGERSVILAPEPGANFIVESVPNTFITGGRASSNVAASGSRRFFTASDPPAPWLDAVDIDYLNEWGVTHIVARADDTRLPQLLLGPDRFEHLADTAGFRIFRVTGDLTVTPADELFAAMNALYAEDDLSRWGPGGFDLTQPAGDADSWAALAAAWADRPQNDLTRLGLAFTWLMMGDDAAVLTAWSDLHAEYPDVAPFTGAVAHLRAARGGPAEAAQTLLAALDSADPRVQMLAARTLLTADFYHLLTDDQLDRALSVTEAHPVIWRQLVVFNNHDAHRERIVLLTSRQRWDAAAHWSGLLPPARLEPHDFVTRASLALVEGEVDAALAILAPTLDPDLTAANRHLHPDRWADNVAAQMAYLLRGEVAQRDGQRAVAALAYDHAAAAGADWLGRYRAQQLDADEGQTRYTGILWADLRNEWQRQYNTPPPEFAPLLSMTDTGLMHLLAGTADYIDGDRVAVHAVVGSPHLSPYPVETVRVLLVSPDAVTVYAARDLEPVILPGAFTHVTTTLDPPTGVPELTPARVIIQPRYDNRVTFPAAASDIVLNRPAAAQVRVGARPVNARFGPALRLVSHRLEVDARQLDLTHYWLAEADIDENYQIFIHVVDQAGNIVQQRDTAPVDGRYPTRHWRVDTLIEDRHRLTFDEPLPPGTYRVVLGLYRLPGGVRLPVDAPGQRDQADNLTLTTFTIE